MEVNSQMRGTFLSQMKVNRERMSVVPGMPGGNLPKALSDEVGGDPAPLDLDQFGINSPKLPQSSQLGKAVPRDDDKQGQAHVLNLVMAKQ